MAYYNGNVKDFQFAPRSDLYPVVIFTPSSAGVGVLSTLLFPRPVEATPDVDGAFTVALEPGDLVRPSITYVVSIKWLNGAGVPTGLTTIPGVLALSSQDPPGTQIADRFTSAGNPYLVWISATPPPHPDVHTLWLDESSVLHEWS